MAKQKKPTNAKELERILASQLIQFTKGERIPSIRELASMTRMSIGAVSKALNCLEEYGAIKIERRGRLGSILADLSFGELWNRIEEAPMVLAMSLPMHRRFEGLATGLKLALEKSGIEAYMIFIRGSRTRLKALQENRCHVAIMSGLAADELRKKEQEVVLRLPPGSWISEYCIFYQADSPVPGKPFRVVIDPDSYDHKRITELEFIDQEVSYSTAPFVQFSRLMRNGDVDSLIWSTDQEEDYFGPQICHKPISEKVMELIGNKSMSAAFVTRTDDAVLKAALNATIKADEIMEIQNKVVIGSINPEY